MVIDQVCQENVLFVMIDNVPYMAWYKDSDGKFIVVNQLFADSCGKDRASIIGKTDFDIWPHNLATDYTKEDADVILSRKPKLIEERIWGLDGPTWFETYRTPIFGRDGKVIGTVGTAKDITVRKKMQLEMENQKRFVKSMIDVIPDLIFFKDLNGMYLGCNDAFATQYIGLSEASIIGKTDADFHHDAEQASFFRQKDLEAMALGKTTINEEWIQLVNGEQVLVETSKTPFYDDGNNVKGIIGIARDITKRKLIENQIKESELRMFLATGNAKIGLWDWSIQSEKVVINEQWAVNRGYMLEELEPVSLMTWMNAVHPDDLPRAQALINQCLLGNLQLYECELRLSHKDGHWIWVLDRGKVVEWDSDDKPSRMIGTYIDISNQKKIENELRQSERILSAVALSIKELIDTRDYLKAIESCFVLIGEATMVDRVYMFVNAYDEEGKGTTSQAIEWNAGSVEAQISNPDLQNLSFEDVDSFIGPIRNGDAFYGVVSALENDRTRELLEAQSIKSIIVLPIIVRDIFWGFLGFDECKYERVWSESEFSILIAFTHSIEKTIERSMIEKELELARESAETANLLKSQFVANMSHEIRTPIHAMLGYASLIKEDSKEDKHIGYLHAIEKAGDTLMSLLNDILDLSKIEAGKLELQRGHFDLRKLFDDVDTVFRLKTIEKNIQLDIVVDPQIPKYIFTDEMRVRQVLFNLIGNAVKFTLNGFIRVRAEIVRVSRDDRRIDLCLCVQDTGIGIPENQQAVIFEPFKQTDGQSNKKYGGTGLGLSISKRLVEMMGGTITLKSTVDQGSTFTVLLPRLISYADSYLEQEEPIENQPLLNVQTSKKPSKAIQDSSPEMILKMIEIKATDWEVCRENNRVSDLRLFAQKVREIGGMYVHDETIQYGDSLLASIRTYDLKNVKNLLEEFPERIKALGGQ